ncbi:hypothetical protein F5X96DRAFT_400310 [Biscogniauxia mediterranea]|nr:hypothetical protein F5X96DRAFT_400310 [Biscogniauxia mediterranea]
MNVLGIIYFLITSVIAIPTIQRDGKISYDGYKVYKVAADGDDTGFITELDALSVIDLSHHGYAGSTKEATFNIAVPPESVAAFDALNLNADILSDDLGADIAAEGSFGDYATLRASSQDLPSLAWFDSYHAYEDHIQYWADLQASFPDNSELIEAGTSFEGRPLQGIHLWGSGGKDSKPAIFFNGNVHAREWITSKVVEYITYQLIVGYENDTLVQGVLDKYDFYILPVVNPDGFVYSQTTDRLWRKNRQTRANTTAVGTDINRNWSVGFGGGGSSADPASGTFSGYAAGDAPETAGLMALAQRLAGGGIKLYVDWHSYAQVILLSYGYTCSAFPGNLEAQLALAAGAAAAIAAAPYNTTFDYGPGCLVLYQSSGNGRDYMTDAAGAEYGWGIELRDTQYGFVLPPEQILPSGVEIWEGMRYIWGEFVKS